MEKIDVSSRQASCPSDYSSYIFFFQFSTPCSAVWENYAPADMINSWVDRSSWGSAYTHFIYCICVDVHFFPSDLWMNKSTFLHKKESVYDLEIGKNFSRYHNIRGSIYQAGIFLYTTRNQRPSAFSSKISSCFENWHELRKNKTRYVNSKISFI